MKSIKLRSEEYLMRMTKADLVDRVCMLERNFTELYDAWQHTVRWNENNTT